MTDRQSTPASSRWRFQRLAFGLLALLAMSSAAAAQGLPLIRDTEIENLLNDYAQPLFEKAGLGRGRIAVRIVRDDTYNAFVLDGRNVFIHTGTLMQSMTPNQIIGVIAHETGHIAGGHMAALRARIARDQTRMLMMRIIGIGAAIATGRGEAMAAADELILRSLLAERRSQEGAADQAGLTYLEATRQSGRGMLETFERFAQQELFSDAQKDAFVRSHPVAVDRLRQLREKVQRSAFFPEKDPPLLQLRHDMMRAKLAGYLERPQSVLNRYPQSDQSLPARYARAIAKYFMGGQTAVQNAVADIDALIREKPSDRYFTPYFWELKGDVLMRSGKPRDAIDPLRKARTATNSSLINVRLAQALLGSEDDSAVNEAIDLCVKAIEGDKIGSAERDAVRAGNPTAYRLLAQGYGRRGRVPEADLATAEAYFLEGDIKQAQIFAKRAQMKLTPNTPAWRNADDIVSHKPQT